MKSFSVGFVTLSLLLGEVRALPHESGAAVALPTTLEGQNDISRDFSNNSIEANFIGGKQVSVKDFPFAIAMLREGGGRPQTQSCTGAVIAPRKILSAAHCVDAPGKKTFAYGLDDLNNGEIKKLELVSFKKHPKYTDYVKGYDIAVATTKEDIPIMGGKFPKVLTSADKGHVKDGMSAFALGYGMKDIKDNSKNVELYSGNLPTVNADTCNQSGQGLKVIPAHHICSGTSSGRPVTALPGNSGGPLIVNGAIAGVASWSKSTWDWYTIYARLDADGGDWVAEEMKK